MRITKIVLAAISGAILLLLMGIEGARATLITIDGAITDWPGNNTTTPPYADALVETDTTEPGQPDRYDVEFAHFTNSGADFFWRIDTVAATDISDTFSRVQLCLDMDDNSGTGISEPDCNNIGAEIKIELWFQLAASTEVAYDNGGSWATCNTSYPVSATSDRNTEIRVPVSVLESDCFQTITDGMIMQQAFQFKGSLFGNEDNVPDSGSTQIQAGTGSPTAVRLTDLRVSARSEGSL